MYTDFLRTVVSPSGFNCITEIHPKHGGGTWARNNAVAFSNAEATDGLIRNLQHNGTETYFALAAFAALREDGLVKRTQDNVVALRSFWLDIDAGEKKYAKHGDAVYPTQSDALNALHAEIRRGVLPRPTYIVSSGEGLHVYWCMNEDVAPAQWRPAADKLGRYCASVGLRVDSSRTTDSASVLRPVGTVHFGSGRTVQALEVGSIFTRNELMAAFMALPVPDSLLTINNGSLAAITGISAPASSATLMAQSSMSGMTEYPPASFGKIIERQHYQRTGCQQLMHCYMKQTELEEPMWYKALSVAQFCTTDRDEWVHKLSQFHPKYERGETERKAAQARGPASCAAFEQANPEGCRGCPHYGKITNPIVLGYEPQNRPLVVTAQVVATSPRREEFLIPELPIGFFRKDTGGVYTHVPKVMPDGKKSKDEMEEFCVVNTDFYIFERVRESSSRQLYLCRYHSPHDGVVEFTLDSDTIHTVSADFKSRITGAGMPIHGLDRWNHLMSFLNRSKNALINSRAAVESVNQMGWQPNGKDFVLGGLSITSTGTRPAALADKTIARKYEKAFTPVAKGDDADPVVAEWNKILHEMYGSPEAVANQFVIAASLGAVFSSRFALPSHAGGIISLASSGSGRGKTFTCQVALRVYGNPTANTFSSKNAATVNALMSNLGYLNSMPLLRDEITEMSSDEVVDLVYDSTRLGDKERAQGSENDIRDNRTTWRTFFYTTGNTSMYDIMAQGRDVFDGPARRVTEIIVPELTYLQNQTYARELAKRMDKIHGVAGLKLAEWIVKNEDVARNVWENSMASFVQANNVSNEERYWVNHMVSAIVGAVVGEMLGLLPFAAKDIAKYASDLLVQLRTRVGHRAVEKTDYLPQFFIDNVDHTLVASVTHDNPQVITVTELPRGAVYIRVEPKNKMVYINHFIIKQWCSKRKIVQSDFEMELRRRGGKPGQPVQMMANTHHAATTEAQRVWAVPLKG